MITIKLSNKVAYTLIAVLLILTVGLVVYAYSNTPNPGHGADQIIVNINGQEKTLQQAIDDGDFGGNYEYPNCVKCSWTGWRCVDQEDGPYDWYGNCQNQCIVEVKTGQFC